MLHKLVIFNRVGEGVFPALISEPTTCVDVHMLLFEVLGSYLKVDYLKELFGDEVEGVLATLEAEREKKARGEESEMMDELIRFKFSDSWNLEGVSG